MRLTQTGASNRLRLQLMAAEHVEKIGARIRQRREELGMSRDDLAREMPGKTNGNAIYRWEKGLHEARPDALEAVAQALNVDVAYFYVDQPKGPTPDVLDLAVPHPNGDDRLQRIERKLDHLLRAIGLDAEDADLNSAVDAFVRALEARRADDAEEAAAG